MFNKIKQDARYLLSDKDAQDWKPYIRLAVAGMMAIWLLVISYQILAPRSYTSSWGLMILSTDQKVNLNIQDIGQASSVTTSRQPEYQDPRDDYIYIASSVQILAAAADIVGIEAEEFDEPTITADSDSALMTFEIKGDSPEEAQNKSLALYKVLDDKISSLRDKELMRRNSGLQALLKKDKELLDRAQAKIAEFKRTSSFYSDEQISTLAIAIENLRTTYAEKQALITGLDTKLSNLSGKKISVKKESFHEAYILQTDPAFQQLLSAYSAAQSSFAQLQTGVGASHPSLLEKKAELASEAEALKSHAERLLGRNIPEHELIQMASSSWLETLTELSTLQGESKGLTEQIARLEKRVHQLDQEKLTYSQTRADFLVAESILAGTIAKLRVGQDDIHLIYPPIQLAVEPNLPEDPTSPDIKISILGGIALSCLYIALLIFLRWEKNSPWRNPEGWVV